jgi:hypothetical protein
MAEDRPSLSIDTDWKKQAQEEKRRLAEEAKKREEQAAAEGVAGRIGPAGAATGAGPVPGAGGGEARGGAGAARAAGGRTAGQREMPPATFATLVQSMVTQVLFYLGDLSPRGAEPQVNLDLAKHNVDLLGMLEEKTKNNLSAEERNLLDAALYETRMRYVSVASQYIG